MTKMQVMSKTKKGNWIKHKIYSTGNVALKEAIKFQKMGRKAQVIEYSTGKVWAHNWEIKAHIMRPSR